MSKRRQDRMANEMKRAVALIIQENIKDPRIDFTNVSVTRIDVSNDLMSHARINFSVLGDEEAQKQTMEALQKAKGYIRTALSRMIQVRRFPELDFCLDRSIEHGMHISEILKELKEKEPYEEKYE
ncbi:MAG: 30S ribosome-binding factor RbfA [Syntrophomonadaceae bacterium]|jgi:ribosome-binding factor A|nr:30S ribosome-binding factor RbfA [Syntrophomonadaceae bacterium]